MKRQITRRAAARLLAGASLALAVPEPARPQGKPEMKPKPPASKSAGSARQRRELDKAVQSLEKVAAAVRNMKVPMGTEPAFSFRPLRGAK